MAPFKLIGLFLLPLIQALKDYSQYGKIDVKNSQKVKNIVKNATNCLFLTGQDLQPNLDSYLLYCPLKDINKLEFLLEPEELIQKTFEFRSSLDLNPGMYK